MEQNRIVGGSRGSVQRLFDVLAEEHGVDLAPYRVSYVERRIGVRLQALGISTYRQYTARLREDPGELERLVSALTINVTQFFRDPATFDAIRARVVPALKARGRADGATAVRVWSAGCATGQEAYSAAMCLLAGGLTAAEGFALSVLGTDIDTDALERARHAIYPARERDDVPEPFRSRFTDEPGPEVKATFRVRPAVTERCRFREASLLDAPAARGFDLVLCRNVLIYLRPAFQHVLIDHFHAALRDGGFLVLGQSERLGRDDQRRFTAVDGRERIYRKAGGVD